MPLGEAIEPTEDRLRTDRRAALVTNASAQRGASHSTRVEPRGRREAAGMASTSVFARNTARARSPADALRSGGERGGGSWPVHLAGTRARLRCPTTLVVITTNERTARWAAKPIDLGRTQATLQPLVIGPRQIPRTLELREARACPELATLAVLVHGRRPGSKRLGRIALEVVLERLAKGHTEDRLLLELIVGSLPKRMMREIEVEMDLNTAPLLGWWSKERIAKGRRQGLKEGRRDGLQEGQQQALLLVLRSRGLVPTPAQRRRIESCTEPRQLAAWLRRAARVDSVAQLLESRTGR
jgi:hypothetical protein